MGRELSFAGWVANVGGWAVIDAGRAVLSWSASTNPNLDHYSIRMSPGPSYDSATASVIGSQPPGSAGITTLAGLASIIETEHGTVPPAAVQIQSLVQSQMNVSVSYDAGGGAHATTIELLWQIVDVDDDFVHSAQLVLGGQQVGPFSADQTINFKTRAANSQGSVDGAVQSITISDSSLAQPTGLTLQVGPMNSIIANWNAVPNATHYEVEKQLIGTDAGFVVVGSPGSPTLQFGAFSSGSVVHVRNRAFGTTGPGGTPESPYIAVAEITFP